MSERDSMQDVAERALRSAEILRHGFGRLLRLSFALTEDDPVGREAVLRVVADVQASAREFVESAA